MEIIAATISNKGRQAGIIGPHAVFCTFHVNEPLDSLDFILYYSKYSVTVTKGEQGFYLSGRWSEFQNARNERGKYDDLNERIQYYFMTCYGLTLN